MVVGGQQREETPPLPSGGRRSVVGLSSVLKQRPGTGNYAEWLGSGGTLLGRLEMEGGVRQRPNSPEPCKPKQCLS
jgi:hypothetical protein